MTNFFNIVKDRMQLSENSRQAFLSVMKKEEYEKGHVLVRPGSICRSIYFVEKGLTRTFYEKDDKDVTDWFSPENTIACSIVFICSSTAGQKSTRAPRRFHVMDFGL